LFASSLRSFIFITKLSSTNNRYTPDYLKTSVLHKNYILGGIQEYKKLERIEGMDCTHLTCISQVDFGNNIFVNSKLVNSAITNSLNSCIEQRNYFNRDYDIDLNSRSGIVDSVKEIIGNEKTSTTTLTQLEKDEVQRARDRFKFFNNAEGSFNYTSIRHEHNNNNDNVAVLARKMEGHVWCKISTSIRCDAVTALSFFLEVTSRSLMTGGIRADKKILETPTPHSQTVLIIEKSMNSNGYKVYNRLNRLMGWEKKGEEIILTNTVDVENAVKNNRKNQNSSRFTFGKSYRNSVSSARGSARRKPPPPPIGERAIALRL